MTSVLKLCAVFCAFVSLTACVSVGYEELNACVNACEVRGGPTRVTRNLLTRSVSCDCFDGSTQPAPTYEGEPL